MMASLTRGKAHYSKWLFWGLVPIMLMMLGLGLCAYYRDRKVKEIRAEYAGFKRGLYA